MSYCRYRLNQLKRSRNAANWLGWNDHELCLLGLHGKLSMKPCGAHIARENLARQPHHSTHSILKETAAFNRNSAVGAKTKSEALSFHKVFHDLAFAHRT